MALRVTQNIMYNSMVNGTNRTLSALMESNLQSSSHLRINRPSDDPVGAGRVISYNASLYNLNRYGDNISQALGWLNMADGALTGEGSVENELKRIMTLAEQAATGTYTDEQREAISYELREIFGSLINLSNSTSPSGHHLFAGHKTDQPAYHEALGVTSRNIGFNEQGRDIDPITGDPIPGTGTLENGDVTMTAEGGADYTVIVQFTSTGQIGTGTTYRYSPDGGKTWYDSDGAANSITQEGDDFVLHAGGASIRFNNAAAGTPPLYPLNVTAVPDGDPSTAALDPSKKEDTAGDGTWLYIRPTAVYQGDDNDTEVVLPYGSTNVTSASAITGTTNNPFTQNVDVRIDGDDGVNLQYSYSTDGGATWNAMTAPSGSTSVAVPGGKLNFDTAPTAANTGEVFNILKSPAATGYFTRDVAVRIDGDDPLPGSGNLTYSYSTDDGSTWTQVTAPSGSTELPVPGGYLNLATAPTAANVGEQYTIHPHRADVNLAIGASDSITVNMVGKDIFGGLYADPRTGELVKASTAKGVNLFETVGDLIAALETNSQEGVQEVLGKMKGVMENVLTRAAVVGGRENRIMATSAALSMRKLDVSDSLSAVEDVDVVTLMARMAMEEAAYNSVLKSSSMIMQMSLVNFL